MPKLFALLSLLLATAAPLCRPAPGLADGSGQGRVVRLLFVGDTSFGENYQSAIKARGGVDILEAEGYDYSLQGVGKLLEGSDVVIANLETPLTDMTVSPLGNWKKYIHRGDPQRTPATLRRHGVRAVSLANNHALDYGGRGLEETLTALKDHGIQGFGAGMSRAAASKSLEITLFADGEPFHVRVLGGCWYGDRALATGCAAAGEERPGVNAWTGESAAAQVRSLRQSHGDAFIVCFPHWGENYGPVSPGQSRIGRMLVDAGADLVIGHGAHLLQKIERYRGKWILYNLGNFVFNSPGRYGRKKADPFSLAALLEVAGEGAGRRLGLRLYPLFTDNRVTRYRTRAADGEEAVRVLEGILARSADPARLRRELRPGRDEGGHYFALHVGTVKKLQPPGSP